MEIQKVFVNPNGGTAVLKCPHCGNVKTLCVGKFSGSMRRVKIRCSCQTVFAVVFEFRKHERKSYGSPRTMITVRARCLSDCYQHSMIIT